MLAKQGTAVCVQDWHCTLPLRAMLASLRLLHLHTNTPYHSKVYKSMALDSVCIFSGASWKWSIYLSECPLQNMICRNCFLWLRNTLIPWKRVRTDITANQQVPTVNSRAEQLPGLGTTWVRHNVLIDFDRNPQFHANIKCMTSHQIIFYNWKATKLEQMIYLGLHSIHTTEYSACQFCSSKKHNCHPKQSFFQSGIWKRV